VLEGVASWEKRNQRGHSLLITGKKKKKKKLRIKVAYSVYQRERGELNPRGKIVNLEVS